MLLLETTTRKATCPRWPHVGNKPQKSEVCSWPSGMVSALWPSPSPRGLAALSALRIAVSVVADSCNHTSLQPLSSAALVCLSAPSQHLRWSWARCVGLVRAAPASASPAWCVTVRQLRDSAAVQTKHRLFLAGAANTSSSEKWHWCPLVF